MLKKSITYTDYNGVEQTEDVYFNLTKVECAELEYSMEAGMSLSSFVSTLISTKDMGAILATIKKIVLTAYGVKSPDGKRFIKSDQLSAEFAQTIPYETIYWELVTEPDKAADFIAGILPSDIRGKLGDNPKKKLLDSMREYQQTDN
jgi:hypothetical protein